MTQLFIEKHIIITPEDFEQLSQGEVITKMLNEVTTKYKIMFNHDLLAKLTCDKCKK